MTLHCLAIKQMVVWLAYSSVVFVFMHFHWMVAIPMHAAFLHRLKADLLMHTLSSCVP